ncbi:MAG TPA: hypothetical protein P5234_13735 [Thermoanaerobaculaceae bacterium]|nr:hypothetical protein [Thermoanaerobaculaceae bacterium]HRS17291.1 hypothetical protein [Thermoanaerobaculaceae bacterium]
MTGSKRLGELLLEAEAITAEDLERALEIQSSSGERLGSVLLRLHMVDSRLLGALLARQHGVEAVDLAVALPQPRALALLSREQAHRLGCLPLRVVGDEVEVVFTDPMDARVVAEVERTVGRPVRRLVAPQTSVFAAIMRHYPPEGPRRR